MSQPYAYQQIDSAKCILWISPESTMDEIQRFVGIMGVFEAEGYPDPLTFKLTPKKGLKSRLLYHCNVTVVRGLPHPRFSHPTTGKRIIRMSEVINLAKTLSGIPVGQKLTTKSLFSGLSTKG